MVVASTIDVDHSSLVTIKSKTAPTKTPSWAWQANKIRMDTEPFKLSAAMQHKTFRSECFTGASVKAVSRPITCFVGRLDKNTTAEELADYLSNVGIQHAV
jgi:catechol-2,3-dioxygenase